MQVTALFFVLAQMTIIFFLSSITADTFAAWGLNLGPYSYLIHIPLYAGLGAFLYLALLKRDTVLRGAYAFTLGALFALSDEIHQSYVPGRTFQTTDIDLDLIGLAVGIAATFLLLKFKK